MILSFSCTSSITFWGALGGLLGRRCVRNGASESLVNMQGSASCIDMIFRICDFIILSNRLYYFLGVLLGVSWLFGRAEFPSWKLPPLRRPLLGALGGLLGFRKDPKCPEEPPGTLMETKMVLRSLQRRLQVDFELLRWPSEPKKLSTTHYLLFISWFLSPLAS